MSNGHTDRMYRLDMWWLNALVMDHLRLVVLMGEVDDTLSRLENRYRDEPKTARSIRG